MKNIIGKKVKMQPYCVYYWRGCSNNNVVTVGSVTPNGAYVNVIDGEGNILPCFPNELRYLNNKPVKLE